jgi:multidrug efflux pump subunit AcrA (membrane-fusion protein)
MKNRLVLGGAILMLAIAAGCQKEAEVPVEEKIDHGRIQLVKEVQDSIGLAVEPVQKKKIMSFTELYGAIAQDTENTTHVLSEDAGILKSFKITEGDIVEEHALIAVIETPQQGAKELHAPTHGIVIARYVKEGDRVDPATSIATIANPDLLRAGFDLYEKDLGRVALGQKVFVTSAAYPQKEFFGKVVFISPRMDDVTRTVKARVDIENDEAHSLKFGMFVTGRAVHESEDTFLTVPQEAIQTLGESKVVFVQLSETTFEMREIKIGQETAEEAAVTQGIQTGERVVTRGSFVFKSEVMKEDGGAEGHSHA